MKDTMRGNPAPLGLLGFGMTTVMLNLHNCGLFSLNSAVLGLGIAFGGCAQLIAGVLEFVQGNTFGMTAFCSYGAFWLSFVLMTMLPSAQMATATDNVAFGFYLLLWCIFTLFMTIATLKMNVCLRVVFSSLTVLFLLLAVSRFLDNPSTLDRTCGVVGIVCGLSAFYLAVAEVINDTYGYPIFPIGSPKIREKLLDD
eukprot:Gregarina_sp_Poly_1__1035@NODE_1253_length_4621_cov_230_546552_g854_i0_p4_GENE_NODE_1253_length_4621_cov_230_546552_g854_i0NODE_1253_length_4621_cov_230_546552_g854_i0_p4_ORF_typecomplete_len198_score17_73Gpr1_Fun34_YaaH/PF01184_19/1_4e55Cas1_AcylT/PF07779_12/0_01DUF2070/PF09843_9/8_2_NODE_1253_length_4621_cov_230_546552_g854_i034404033